MILLIGANHRTAPLDLREKLYLNPTQHQLLLAQMRANISTLDEVVILSTCNRLEVYAVVADSDSQHALIAALSNSYDIEITQWTQHTYIKFDRDAVSHLMEVASGLDSLVLGEPQILGQVSDSLEMAQSMHSSGAILNQLFTDTIYTGKRTRTETNISRHSISISHIAVSQMLQNIPSNSEPSVLIIGAGEMATSAVHALLHHNVADIQLINRTDARATKLATSLGITAYRWDQRWTQLSAVDAVIIATSASEPILKRCDLQFLIETRQGKPLTIVDVSVPRSVEIKGFEATDLVYYDIDDLNEIIDEHLAQRQACIPLIKDIIANESERFLTWLASRLVVPTIKGLRQKVHNVVQLELEDAMSRLDHLDDEDKAILQRFAHRVVNKVLHDPTTNLRINASKSNVIDYTQALSELFALKAVD